MPISSPRFVRAPAAVVAPVPPLLIAKVPWSVMVPVFVIGPPVVVSPVVPPDTPTLVTPPEPPMIDASMRSKFPVELL